MRDKREPLREDHEEIGLSVSCRILCALCGSAARMEMLKLTIWTKNNLRPTTSIILNVRQLNTVEN